MKTLYSVSFPLLLQWVGMKEHPKFIGLLLFENVLIFWDLGIVKIYEGTMDFWSYLTSCIKVREHASGIDNNNTTNLCYIIYVMLILATSVFLLWYSGRYPARCCF